jgi:putative nucleotidyltransferase with HDIG domain
MGRMLIITDNVGRSAGLANEIFASAQVTLLNLYHAAIPLEPASSLVVDIFDLRSDTIARLRRLLGRTPRSGPLVMLLHKDVPRVRILAIALGAALTLCTPFDIPQLRAFLAASEDIADPTPLASSVLQLTGEAQNFLVTAFVPGQPITPAIANTGSSFIRRAIGETGIRDWVRAVRRFDDSTHQHCLLVAGLAAAFAKSLGLGDLECHRLTKAALLHDVGKIHVPVAILNKPGKLDANEMAVMKRHPQMGHAMLAGQGFHLEVLQVVRSHHELLDGSGYPDGLKATEIPDLVRVLTVCDIYAALIERRSYKAPMPSAKAFAILRGMTGRLDATIVEAFRPVAAAFIPRFSQDAGAMP